MSRIYLLDSDAHRYITRGVPEYVEGFAGIREQGSLICLPSPVIEETLIGLRNPACTFSEEEKHKILNWTMEFPIRRFDERARAIHEAIQAELASRACPIGGPESRDSQIASIAISNNATLVTNNIRHLGRIRGLKLETFIPAQKRKLNRIQSLHQKAQHDLMAIEAGSIRPASSEGEYLRLRKSILRVLDRGIDRVLKPSLSLSY